MQFRESTYTRIKTINLTIDGNDKLISEFGAADISRLRSMYVFDAYDSIKRITTELAFLTDKKRLGKTKILDFINDLIFQVTNVLFLTKRYAVLRTQEKENVEKIKRKKKGAK